MLDKGCCLVKVVPACRAESIVKHLDLVEADRVKTRAASQRSSTYLAGPNLLYDGEVIVVGRHANHQPVLHVEGNLPRVAVLPDQGMKRVRVGHPSNQSAATQATRVRGPSGALPCSCSQHRSTDTANAQAATVVLSRRFALSIDGTRASVSAATVGSPVWRQGDDSVSGNAEIPFGCDAVVG